MKSEAQWQSHLHSTQHNLRSQRAKDARELRGAGVGAKRKAESPVREVEGERKRARPEDGGEEDQDEERAAKAVKIADDAEQDVDGEQASTNGIQPPTIQQPNEGSADGATAVDEAEFLAFERELAEMESQAYPTSVLNAQATISAAPLTAEQLAAQATDEKSTQRGRRDAEVEEEKEDAARVLAEEFEEMRGLEDRLKRLRERREGLRRPSATGDEGAGVADVYEGNERLTDGAVVDTGGEDEDEDEDEEYYDDWGFSGVG